MSQRNSYAVGTGLFILLGFVALVYLATQTSSIANVRQGDSYQLHVRFADIGQLKDRAPVKVAGVRIGQVAAIALDPKHDQADVTLSIEDRYHDIPVDSVATIYTSGLLGDQYVGIDYGHATKMLANGDTLALSKSSQPLEEMLSRFLGSGGAADDLGGNYHVIADFSNVGALSVGAPVKMAGVPIGTVSAVQVDPTKLDAKVTLAIDSRFNQIPSDSAAAIFTSGLIGGQYVSIQPGGSPQSLKDGDEIILTQSAMQLEDLIGKFLVNGSSSASGNGGGSNGGKSAPSGGH